MLLSTALTIDKYRLNVVLLVIEVAHHRDVVKVMWLVILNRFV